MASTATTGPRPDVTAPAAGPGRGRDTTRKVLGIVVLVVLTIVFVAPLVWMVSTSVKTPTGATRWPLQWIPPGIESRAYDVLRSPTTNTPVFRWFLNSMLAATSHALLVVATAAPAAYALARLEFRGKRLLWALVIATLFVPPIIFLTPNYIIVDTFGWVDSLTAVVVPGAASAFGVFFMRQFFLGLPEELEEAALVDGASRFGIFWRIVLPLSKPALATLLILSFLTNWNDFLWPLYVLFSPEYLTLPAGLGRLQGAYTTDYPIIMAGAVIASVPVLALFVFAQRFIIEGVSRSGIKG